MNFLKKIFGKRQKVVEKVETEYRSGFEYGDAEINVRTSAMLSTLTTTASTVLTAFEHTPADVTEKEREAFEAARVALAEFLKHVAEEAKNISDIAASKHYYKVNVKTGERV